MRLSIVPEIMNSEEIKFLDDNNIPVEIAEKSPFRFNYNEFRNPSFIVDNFERGKYKHIEIRRVDIGYLAKIGYRIVSTQIRRHSLKNYPGQKKMYSIQRRTDNLGNGMELVNMPGDHYIEVDVINNRIRLRGRSSYPYITNENATPWVDIKNG